MLNLSIIQGRFSAEPELKKTPAGNSVIAFTLACQREKKGEDGVYPTDWIPCAAWNGTAEFIARNFKKGDLANVQGSLRQRDWTDKDGNKRKSYEVSVQSIHFCGKRQTAEENVFPVERQERTYEVIEETDEGLPF